MTAQLDEKESSSTLQLEFGWSPSMSRNKCFIFISYICTCIIAFHLGTIEEPREWRDDGVEPEDGEWWTRLEDGRLDSDVLDRRKMLAEHLFFN